MHEESDDFETCEDWSEEPSDDTRSGSLRRRANVVDSPLTKRDIEPSSSSSSSSSKPINNDDNDNNVHANNNNDDDNDDDDDDDDVDLDFSDQRCDDEQCIFRPVTIDAEFVGRRLVLDAVMTHVVAIVDAALLPSQQLSFLQS
jgi:hypothetical protein